jgi:hypothetical protein
MNKSMFVARIFLVAMAVAFVAIPVFAGDSSAITKGLNGPVATALFPPPFYNCEAACQRQFVFAVRACDLQARQCSASGGEGCVDQALQCKSEAYNAFENCKQGCFIFGVASTSKPVLPGSSERTVAADVSTLASCNYK